MCGVPEGQKNQYLVDAILKKEDGKWLEKVIRETVREELKCGDVQHNVSRRKEEIPNEMLDFLYQMENE